MYRIEVIVMQKFLNDFNNLEHMPGGNIQLPHT